MKKTLMKLIKQTSAVEQKWLIRIMLKDTKLHLGQKNLLNEFHEDAEDLYNVTTSLKTVRAEVYLSFIVYKLSEMPTSFRCSPLVH